MDSCPHCGSEEYYIKQRVKGLMCYRLRFDGKESDNTDIYDGLSYDNASKYAWCNKCNKRLFKK